MKKIAIVTVVGLLFLGGAIGLAGAESMNESAEGLDEDVSIDPAVLEGDGETTVMVRLEERPETVVQATATEEQIDSMKTHAESSQEPLETFASQHSHVEIEQEFWITNAVLVTVDTAEMPIERLGTVDNVDRIHENFEVEPAATETAPTSSDTPATTTEPTAANTTSTSHGDYTDGLEQINAPEAWEYNQGEGVRIAVLDTGIDIDSHDDLELRTDDPDDETYPGGWAQFDADGEKIPGSEPHDTSFHGTHVTGTVGGGTSELGTDYGVAPEAELMHGEVLGASWGSFAATMAGMEWAVENDADIVSMSLGAPGTDDAFIDPVQNTHEAGVLVVASSGNNDQGPEDTNEVTHTPANVYESISVGAVDHDDETASLSSGETIVTDQEYDTPPEEWPDEFDVPDVTAPGLDVLSAVPDGEYAYVDGTSMAAPHVTGAAALVLAEDGDRSPEEVREILAETGADISEPRNHDTRIDAHAAVEAVADDAGEPTFAITIENIDDKLIEGDDVVVEYTVENTGSAEGSQDIEFTVNGAPEETLTDLTLAEAEDETNTFTYTTDSDDVGELTAVVESSDDADEETVIVDPAEDPFFDVTIDDAPNAVTEGEDIVVEYTVENIRPVTGSQDIEFVVDGSSQATNTNLTLEEAENETKTFRYTTDSADIGDRTVGIESDDDTDGATVSVVESDNEYVNDDGIVGTDGLRIAIDDWRNNEIETDQLRDVIDAWRNNEPVYTDS